METGDFICRTKGCLNEGIVMQMPINIPMEDEHGSPVSVTPPTYCGACSNIIAPGSVTPITE